MAGDGGDAGLVGLVIVSHSAKVADGTLELASQMAGDDVRIVAAGGLEDGSIGTDATRIMAAIEAADSGAGVVVMVDLGSAVLSASTALELLDPAQAARVRLSRGPVVEGAIVAAIQASIGDDLLTVCDAADATLTQDKLAE
ncbi:MAG: dihydroxyacetone kinase phosphoryl donor subunit DhaM [Candidatus Limnocylindrales bacterium]|nr:dihydroxyacetone kinase phosphoryl donor subunit DhaM [Candidatus Limnocylindrales bacterium]